jgi:SWIM zinc finger
MVVTIDSQNPRSIAAIGLAVRSRSWARVETKDGQPFHGIPSRSEPGVIHIADTQTCTCPDHKYRGVACAHILAARIAREQAEVRLQLQGQQPKVSRYVEVFGGEEDQ